MAHEPDFSADAEPAAEPHKSAAEIVFDYSPSALKDLKAWKKQHAASELALDPAGTEDASKLAHLRPKVPGTASAHSVDTISKKYSD